MQSNAIRSQQLQPKCSCGLQYVKTKSPRCSQQMHFPLASGIAVWCPRSRTNPGQQHQAWSRLWCICAIYKLYCKQWTIDVKKIQYIAVQNVHHCCIDAPKMLPKVSAIWFELIRHAQWADAKPAKLMKCNYKQYCTSQCIFVPSILLTYVVVPIKPKCNANQETIKMEYLFHHIWQGFLPCT